MVVMTPPFLPSTNMKYRTWQRMSSSSSSSSSLLGPGPVRTYLVLRLLSNRLKDSSTLHTANIYNLKTKLIRNGCETHLQGVSMSLIDLLQCAYLPELQAFVHDGVGGEEEQHAFGNHSSKVNCNK